MSRNWSFCLALSPLQWFFLPSILWRIALLFIILGSSTDFRFYIKIVEIVPHWVPYFWIIAPHLFFILALPNIILWLCQKRWPMSACFPAVLYRRNSEVLSEQKCNKQKSHPVCKPSFKGLIPLWLLVIACSF